RLAYGGRGLLCPIVLPPLRGASEEETCNLEGPSGRFLVAHRSLMRYSTSMKQRRRPARCEEPGGARHRLGPYQGQTAASLIEALCVVALLLILTTLYWSSGSESRQQQRIRACQRNLGS